MRIRSRATSNDQFVVSEIIMFIDNQLNIGWQNSRQVNSIAFSCRRYGFDFEKVVRHDEINCFSVHEVTAESSDHFAYRFNERPDLYGSHSGG